MQPRKRKGGRFRDADRTRKLLLEAAFEEVHRSGYRSADLDAILDRAGVTKGALYYHFASKEALGYALVDENLAGLTREKWIRPLESAENPIDVLIEIVETTSMTSKEIRNGCPVQNLAVEMSPLDEGFRKRLAKVFGMWIDGVADCLRDGRKRHVVRHDLDPDDTAMYFVALYEGYLTLAKNSQDARVLNAGKKKIVEYLESLRAPASKPVAARGH